MVRPGFMYGNDGYNSQSTDWFEMAETVDVVYRGDREKGWSWIHIGEMRGCLDAAGYSGEIRFDGPLKGHNASTWFDQDEFMTSEKARRILGWVPRRPGVLAALPAAYASWKASRQLG